MSPWRKFLPSTFDMEASKVSIEWFGYILGVRQTNIPGAKGCSWTSKEKQCGKKQEKVGL